MMDPTLAILAALGLNIGLTAWAIRLLLRKPASAAATWTISAAAKWAPDSIPPVAPDQPAPETKSPTEEFVLGQDVTDMAAATGNTALPVKRHRHAWALYSEEWRNGQHLEIHRCETCGDYEKRPVQEA